MYKKLSAIILLLIIIITSGYFLKTKSGDTSRATWEVYGGSNENTKYSALSQIDTSNVNKLEVAWIYHSEKNDSTLFAPMECNPIIIDNVLYGVSPKLKLFAVDAETGIEKWQFNPDDSITNKTWRRNSVNMNRGVTYWSEGNDKRIIYTVGPIVFAVNAETGKLVPGFGKDGGIDLRKGLDRDESTLFVAPTSPVMVHNNVFFVSGLVGENTPGHIRGFDVKTGEQKWIFHTIPYPGEPGYETWEDTTAYKRLGSANSWCGFSLDKKRGILFAATGNPTNDFYGGDRLGDGLYGNCILAIEATTGKLLWHFQTVHHDVWDMDISSPPVLFTLNKNGKKTDAIAQTTKTGLIFVLDRETGKPLYPVEELPVPIKDLVEGEKLSPTQPFPVLPKPFVRHHLTENDLNTLVDDSSYQDILKRFRYYRHEGIYTPPTEKGTIIFPGYDGGGEWGGPAIDPETNILYVNANEMAWILNLVKNEAPPKKALTNLEAGTILYNTHCRTCHGPDRAGSGDNPTLLEVEKKYSFNEFSKLINTGRRMMPGFAHLDAHEKKAIASYILNMKDDQNKRFAGDLKVDNDISKPSYSSTGYYKFLTKEGYPAISPPWGTLNALNLNTGEYVWKIPLGEFEELKKQGVPTTGRENYGGPVVTAGGLIFIAATADGKFRAINKRTGSILWEIDLPAPGVATPAVYEIKGKQYVVIACGGSKWGGKQGDAYVAFALP